MPHGINRSTEIMGLETLPCVFTSYGGLFLLHRWNIYISLHPGNYLKGAQWAIVVRALCFHFLCQEHIVLSTFQHGSQPVYISCIFFILFLRFNRHAELYVSIRFKGSNLLR